MQRVQYIERIQRDIYSGYVPADAQVTVGLINNWLPDALALAAKQAYNDTLQIDGIAAVNNGFYVSFKGLSITEDEYFSYKIVLPEVPPGLGRNEGVSTVQIKDTNNNLSYTALPLSQAQVGYMQSLVKGPEELWYFTEGKNLYISTTLLLSVGYTASVRMISGGDSTDLTSELNCPPDYLPVMDMYLIKKGREQRTGMRDSSNDGIDKN